MQGLINAPRGGWVFGAMCLFGIGVFAYAVGVLMLPYSELLGERLPELTCLQVAFGAERATSIVLSFSPEQRVAIGNLLLPGDVTFAWGYGFLFAGLVGLVARRLDGAWRRAGGVILWLPLAASALDVIEDLFLYSIVALLVDDPSAVVRDELAVFAGIAAVMKYLALAVVTPAYCIAGVARGIRVDRSVSALLVYAIALLFCASMILRPLQQIPACF